MVEKKQKIQRLYRGVVVSDKMSKTVVVEYKRTFKHAKTDKIMRFSKKYKIHDEQGQAKVGDHVEFFEGKPVSKTKYMYLSKVISSAA